jgi:hypothetical protein
MSYPKSIGFIGSMAWASWYWEKNPSASKEEARAFAIFQLERVRWSMPSGTPEERDRVKQMDDFLSGNFKCRQHPYYIERNAQYEKEKAAQAMTPEEWKAFCKAKEVSNAPVA